MKIYKVTSAIYLSGAIDAYFFLGEHKIDTVINCRSEQHDDVCELTKRGIAYYWIPVPEGQSPRKNQIDLFIWLMKTMPREKRVLVHCSEGRGRSPFLIAAWLNSVGLTLSWAWGNIMKVKPDVSLTNAQLTKLQNYCKVIRE